MNKIMHALKCDAAKYYKIELGERTPPLRRKIGLWLGNYAFHCVLVYRLGQHFRLIFKKNKIIGMLPMMLYKFFNYLIGMIYHVNIDGANIAPGLYIGHVGTIYIGRCEVGENFSVTHNVTIGRGHSAGKVGVPKIGNNVWIGTGSVIYGDMTIGDNVTIGSGCILSRDVPDGCFVCGNPGRVTLQNYDNSGLFGGE